MGQFHRPPGVFQHPGIGGVGDLGLLVDEGEHPGGAGKGVLQFGDHPGDLVKGLGVLVGI